MLPWQPPTAPVKRFTPACPACCKWEMDPPWTASEFNLMLWLPLTSTTGPLPEQLRLSLYLYLSLSTPSLSLSLFHSLSLPFLSLSPTLSPCACVLWVRYQIEMFLTWLTHMLLQAVSVCLTKPSLTDEHSVCLTFVKVEEWFAKVFHSTRHVIVLWVSFFVYVIFSDFLKHGVGLDLVGFVRNCHEIVRNSQTTVQNTTGLWISINPSIKNWLKWTCVWIGHEPLLSSHSSTV